MLLEIKLKYYNSDLKIGFNTWKQIYDVKNKLWLEAKHHGGRVVYGNSRIPYKRIVEGIDARDFIAQAYCPF